MTPKEKAEILYRKIVDSMYLAQYTSDAKQCALVALRDTVWGYLDQQPIVIQNYWQQVKQEIEKL